MRKRLLRTVRGELDERFLVQASGDKQLDIDILVRHTHPGTKSNVKVCVIASGRAKVKLTATVVIENSAHRADARLDIKVVTQGSAIVEAAPNLEIRNHDVKAGHALTTKHITGDELFYLTSRGLSLAQARKLVLNGFIAPFKKGTIIS
ncbi:MAG: SufD family Fe-S cluster assembly protein [Candidatus Nomurabacteria bacterium]|jgi:Fe-S cluster assembly protein SufD|nr:SufD family Fe-S cluster assembly protein [Candidatus Nomurabacteria bacterium]